MRCLRVKKLLFSGGADKGLSPAEREEFKRHLKECAECRDIEKELQESVISPFEQAARYIPSERVWENIKASIETQCSEGFTARGIRWLRENLIPSRPVFAAATVAAILLSLIIVPRAYYDLQERKISSFLYDEMDFFYSLGENNGAMNDDIGIPDEDFFM